MYYIWVAGIVNRLERGFHNHCDESSAHSFPNNTACFAQILATPSRRCDITLHKSDQSHTLACNFNNNVTGLIMAL